MQTRNLLLVSVGLLSAAQVVLGQFLGSNFCYVDKFTGYKKETKRAYDQISDYLTEKVPTDDAQLNMDRIREWIEYERGSDLNRKHNLLKALIQIEALTDKELPGEKCTSSSRQAILENFRMAGVCLDQKSLSKKDYKPSRRIEKIILHYAKRLANGCHDKHVEEYKKRYASLEQEIKDRVSGFIGELIVARIASQPNYMKKIGLTSAVRAFEERPVEVSRYTVKPNKYDAAAANRWLMTIVRDNKDSRAKFLTKINTMNKKSNELDEKNFRLLFYEHLYGTCLSFTNTLQEAFDRNAEIEYFFDTPDEDSMDQLEKDYYKDMALYQGCLNFMESSSLVVKEMLRLKRKDIG